MSDVNSVKEINKLALAISTFGGIGFLPLAPGTIGSAVALPVCWLIADLPVWIEIVGLLVLFFIGVRLSSIVENGSGQVDPGYIVLDEVLGMWISVFTLPKHFLLFFAAFVSFRILDIAKPIPVSHLQKLPGGWGVMLDDVMAGIYSASVIHLVLLIS